MTEPAAPLPAGTRLAHYEVLRVLGTGGMGTVYLARDTALDREVAVKVLRPEVAGDPALRDRFVREARAAARVSHPNLTHVYFVGEAEGRPYFAMEYCPGTTLEAAIRERGPFPLDRGLDVLEQAARGLAAAHGAGVVHRDVKPSNLMVLPDGRVKVTDFGLAKSLSGDVSATAGKIAFHLKVVRPDGNRPGRGAVLVRFLVKYPGIAWILIPPGMSLAQAILWGLQGLAWVAGGLCYFFADGRTLPDLLSRTRVAHRGPGEGARVP